MIKKTNMLSIISNKNNEHDQDNANWRMRTKKMIKQKSKDVMRMMIIKNDAGNDGTDEHEKRDMKIEKNTVHAGGRWKHVENHEISEHKTKIWSMIKMKKIMTMMTRIKMIKNDEKCTEWRDYKNDENDKNDKRDK